MTATITIQAAALDLISTDGYMKRFYVVLSEKGCTQKAAFTVVESEYCAAFRRGKYVDFKSFCRSRRRWFKSRRT